LTFERDKTINNQQSSTINNQQSTINNQQSTINNQQQQIVQPTTASTAPRTDTKKIFEDRIRKEGRAIKQTSPSIRFSKRERESEINGTSGVGGSIKDRRDLLPARDRCC